MDIQDTGENSVAIKTALLTSYDDITLDVSYSDGDGLHRCLPEVTRTDDIKVAIFTLDEGRYLRTLPRRRDDIQKLITYKTERKSVRRYQPYVTEVRREGRNYKLSDVTRPVNDDTNSGFVIRTIVCRDSNNNVTCAYSGHQNIKGPDSGYLDYIYSEKRRQEPAFLEQMNAYRLIGSNVVDGTDSKLLKCSMCDKQYTSKESLVSHMTSFHRHETFSCVCGRRYNWRSSLYRHLRRNKCDSHMY